MIGPLRANLVMLPITGIIIIFYQQTLLSVRQDVLGIFFKTLFISEKKSEILLSGILSKKQFPSQNRPVHSKDFCD